MTEEANIGATGARDQVLEAAGHCELDSMIRDWPIIASMAWEGFLGGGRGHVAIVVEDDGVIFGFRSGAPCPCHADAIAEYDPEAEVVVAVSIGESVDVYRFRAEPRPAEVWAMTPGSFYGAMAH